ncbi:hypothetical protein Hanom_Chr03g00249541 [Helianthus anomalus]
MMNLHNLFIINLFVLTSSSEREDFRSKAVGVMPVIEALEREHGVF